MGWAAEDVCLQRGYACNSMPDMAKSRIHTYLGKEILTPTLLALLVFTLVLLLGRLVKLVDLVINKGVSIWDILVLFGTMLPSFLGICLPLALLMGIMIGLSRLSADSETIALKAVGISLSNMAVPIFSLAIIFTLLTGLASLWAEPWGYRSFKTKVFEITRQKASIGLRPQIFMKQFDNLVFYAGGLDERTDLFRDLFIVEKGPEGETLVLAERGYVSSDQAAETVTIHLMDGTVHRRQSGEDSSYQVIHFKNYDVNPQLEATTAEARLRIKPKGMATDTLYALLKETGDENQAGALTAELHRRLSTPLAPLLFALFALPFGIQPTRSGRSGGIAIALMIYLCYYFMFSFAETLVAEGDATPLMAVWLPHLLLATVGIYLLRRSSQEKPNPLMEWLNQLTLRFKARTAAK